MNIGRILSISFDDYVFFFKLLLLFVVVVVIGFYCGILDVGFCCVVLHTFPDIDEADQGFRWRR
jgi:hypothetical protein